jgi:hypothetical protein
MAGTSRSHETAHRSKQRVGQVLRYAIATGRAERDPTADLRGALAPIKVTNRAAVTDPREVAQLLRALAGYQGHPIVEAALKMAFSSISERQRKQQLTACSLLPVQPRFWRDIRRTLDVYTAPPPG